MLKILVTGDYLNGAKVNLLRQYINPNINSEYQSALMGNLTAKKKIAEEERVLSFLETSGQEEDNTAMMRKSLYKSGLHSIILIFSTADQTSFKHVKEKWLPEIAAQCPNAPIVLTGLKPLENEFSCVSLEDITAIMRSLTNPCKYVDCALNKIEDIEHVIETAVTHYPLPHLNHTDLYLYAQKAKEQIDLLNIGFVPKAQTHINHIQALADQIITKKNMNPYLLACLALEAMSLHAIIKEEKTSLKSTLFGRSGSLTFALDTLKNTIALLAEANQLFFPNSQMRKSFSDQLSSPDAQAFEKLFANVKEKKVACQYEIDMAMDAIMIYMNITTPTFKQSKK